MTAFNFVLHRDFATIVTDSLNTAVPEQRPYQFSSKVHVLANLHAVMGGRGRGLFLDECYRQLSLGLIARDVADADNLVPELYRRLWAEQLAKEEGDDEPSPLPPSATVCHIGWVEKERRIVGFEYSSADNFESDRIKDGAWLHPGTVDILITDPSDLVKITIMQKEIDDKLPVGERAGIGGDIYLYQLTHEGIVAQKAHRFEDYDQQFSEMEAYADDLKKKHGGPPD